MGIAEDDVFVTTPNYVFKFDLTRWGWIHLLLGAVAVLVSIGLFSAAVWARVAGVGIAALLLIVSLLSIPYYPVWSITLIALYSFAGALARRSRASGRSRRGHRVVEERLDDPPVETGRPETGRPETGRPETGRP